MRFPGVAFTMKGQKDKIKEIKSKVKKCIVDKKEANTVIDVLCYSQDEEPAVMLAAVRGLQQIFAHFFTQGDMVAASGKAKDPAQTKLAEWLQQQYYTTCGAALHNLHSSDAKLKEAALAAVMKFVEMEAKHPLNGQQAGSSFPEKLMQDLVDNLLTMKEGQESLIQRLTELTEYDDVRFYLMKALRNSLRNKFAKDRSEVYLSAALSIVFSLQLPEGEQDLAPTLIIDSDGEKCECPPNVSSLKAHKKVFTACLMGLLKSELTPALYRRVLTKLDDKLLPFLSSPLLLADFLTQSYDMGGAISLLALNGIFILITKYNLDYPQFYHKLYSLLQPQVFQAKYCARFFYLADIFLSSTHLPAHLVASFVKRLCRLALSAPPVGARLCVVFVRNLIVRHPALRTMLHRPLHTCPSDPYKATLADPSNTCALDSSLWEVKTLQSHYSPEVAQEAMKISLPVTQETDLADLLEDTTHQMVERLMKKKPPVNVPIEPAKPAFLFDSGFKQFFEL